MIKVGKEREITFDKTLRYKRQEQYDIQEYESIPVPFLEGRSVYKNFNLSIFVDDKCNADCQFCVAQLRYEHRGLLYNKEHITDDKTYMETLRTILEKVRPLNPSISITGGEPTISNRLVPIMKLVAELGFRKRTITTNGSGLFRMFAGKPIIQHLIDCGFDHLNISRVTMDEDLNRTIMRYEKHTDYCSNEMIKGIADYVKGSNLKIRMSCLLLKDSICTVEGIKAYVDFYKEYGIDNFIFRQLMDYDHLAVNQEKIQYCDRNKVDLNDIWEEMKFYPEIKPYLNLVGYYYYVEIYKYNGCTIASESANLEQQYTEKKKNSDMIYEMVFHTNGVLAGSWVPTEDILIGRAEYEKL